MSKFKKQMPQNLVARELKTARSFTYTKKNVSLSFGLSLETTEELKIYLELLEMAKNDVEATLKEITE